MKVVPAIILLLCAAMTGFGPGVMYGRSQRDEYTPLPCEKQIKDFEYRAIARLDEILLDLHTNRCQVAE